MHGRPGGGDGRLLTMVTHVVPQKPLCGKSLGTVRALEVLLCSGSGRRQVGHGGGREEESMLGEGNPPGRGKPPKKRGA